MVKFLQQIILKRKFKSLKRKVKVANLKLFKSALIVYNATNPEEDKIVRQFSRFLKEEGVKVESIGYYKKKNKKDEGPQDELGYYYLKKEELNWLHFPNTNAVKKKIATEYNLLLDLNLSGNFCLQMISSLSKATFKVGRASGYQKDVCDLTISMPKGNLTELIEQMKVYLQMINK